MCMAFQVLTPKVQKLSRTRSVTRCAQALPYHSAYRRESALQRGVADDAMTRIAGRHLCAGGIGNDSVWLGAATLDGVAAVA